MKITIDTDKKEVVCPQMFFDRHHELLQMSKVTGGNEITLEDYLTTLFNDCKGNIKNASIYRKVYKCKIYNKNVGLRQNKNVGKPTFLFCILGHIDTLLLEVFQYENQFTRRVNHHGQFRG